MSSPTIPLIPEILRLICEAALPSKSSLASLARTCTAFEDSALDVLWSNLDQFSHLVKCLPSDLWEITDSSGLKQMTLRQPVYVIDCWRLQEYANRVKKFHFEPDQQKIHVDISIYQSLQVILQGPIFPNLWHLQYDGSDYRLSFLPMFLGPHLKHIHMESDNDGIQQMALIPRLCDTYPLLEEFGFEWVQIRSEQRSIYAVSNAVLRWKDLVSLKVSNISYSTLQELAQYPSLKTLKITRWKFDPNTTKIWRKSGFHSLNELEIGSDSALDCIEVLKMMDSAPVNEALFSFYRGQSSAIWKQFTSSIHDSFRHDHLSSLTVWDEIDEDEEDITMLGEMVGYDAIKPLLVFCNLKTLCMQLPRGLYLSDSMQTEEMASSWSNIVKLEFSIEGYRHCPQKSTITLVDLLPFAEHCAALSSLALFLDGKSVPDITAVKPGSGILQTKLSKLGVNDSLASLKDYKKIAVFLSSVFPSLRKIETIGEFVDEEDMDALTTEVEKAWSKAKGLLQLLSVVRNQEMMYYTT